MQSPITCRSLAAFAVLLLAAFAPLSPAAGQPDFGKDFNPFGEQPAGGQNVQASLIAEHAAIQPGEPITVGFHMKIADTWHAYWKNPNGPGIVPSVAWDLPEGFTAGEMQWPAPKKFEAFGLTQFGYDGEVTFLFEIQTPADLSPGSTVTLKGKAEWQVCDPQTCVDGSEDLSLELPVTADAPSESEHAATIAKARKALPQTFDAWRVAARPAEGGAVLKVTGPRAAALAEAGGLYFYSSAPDVIDAKAEQAVSVEGDTLSIALKLATTDAFGSPIKREQPVTQLTGVLVAKNATFDDAGDHHALAIDTSITTDDGAVAAVSEPSATGSAADDTTLPIAIGLAFIGGLILNLMPCVFPVLSIKILGFVQQAGEDKSIVRNHGFVFGGGVLVSFWALAGLLLALRAGVDAAGGGEQYAWGFQLQNPTFVLAMTLLMVAIGLNLAGVFEVGMGMTSMAGRVGAGAQGYTKSFLTGVLATLIATPCTAPFMAGAVAAALAMPAGSAMLIFTSLGVGMATPYVTLSCLPGLLKYLPRPGAWMESFKQFMAFPMFAVAGWLVWVYSTVTDQERVMWLLLGLVIFAMGLWWYGRWDNATRKSSVRWVARAGAAACVALSVYVASTFGSSQTTWEPYSTQRVAQLRKEGRPVLIDFTASWCVVCQANKRTSLRTESAAELYKEYDVALIEADFSARDKSGEVYQALRSYKREGVPLYVVYPADPGAEPIILPNLLSPGIVEDAIRQAAGETATAKR